MISRLINKNHRKSAFSRNELFFLMIITAIAGGVRIFFLYDREFTGDEVGTLMYTQRSVSYLLSHFGQKLTMNYFIVVEKFISSVFGKGPFSLGLIPLVAGVGTVPLTAALSTRLTSSRVALIAATLVALNPYLIQYSGIMRSYSLLVALSLSAIIAFLKWHLKRSLRNGIWLSVICLFLMLFHLNGIYTIVFIITLVGLDILFNFEGKESLRQVGSLLLPLSVALLLLCISHIKLFPDISIYTQRWRHTPPTSIAYLPFVFSDFFSKGFYSWLSLALLLTGVWISAKQKRPLILLLPQMVIPVVLLSAQGLSYYPWSYSRFLIYCLPILIIFIAEGVWFYGTRIRSPQKQVIISAVLVAALFISWTPNLSRVFWLKTRASHSPAHKAARLIQERYHEGDLILCMGWLPRNQIRAYLWRSTYNVLSLEGFIKSNTYIRPGRSVFMIGPESMQSAQEQFVFGKKKVIIYPFEAKAAVLTRIRSDLLNTVRDFPPLPRWRDHYKAICDIDKYLGNGDDQRYCDLYAHYLQRKGPQRHLPPQFKK